MIQDNSDPLEYGRRYRLVPDSGIKDEIKAYYLGRVGRAAKFFRIDKNNNVLSYSCGNPEEDIKYVSDGCDDPLYPRVEVSPSRCVQNPEEKEYLTKILNKFEKRSNF